SLFCLTVRRPPSSLLFPYTMLFRSLVTGRKSHDQLSGDQLVYWQTFPLSALANLTPNFCRSDENGRSPIILTSINDELTMPELEDRKSTRLNSSHVKIAYADYCQKK